MIINRYFKYIVTVSNSSHLLITEKKGVKHTRVNANTVCNNLTDKNVNRKGNLIPTEYRRAFWTLLGRQEKFDKVIEKVITRSDELDLVQSCTRTTPTTAAIEVKEPTH